MIVAVDLGVGDALDAIIGVVVGEVVTVEGGVAVEVGVGESVAVEVGIGVSVGV